MKSNEIQLHKKLTSTLLLFRNEYVDFLFPLAFRWAAFENCCCLIPALDGVVRPSDDCINEVLDKTAGDLFLSNMPILDFFDKFFYICFDAALFC